MKSVLLGGLKVFLINDGGFPLSAPGGRAKFFEAGTSTPETVYSDIDLTEGTALGPVVYTDALGALPAIWLKTDRLYKVVVEQKVSDDPETWTVLWEVDNVGTFVQEEIPFDGDPAHIVESISSLKEVDHGEYGIIQVLGYYSPGDWGTPAIFIYDSECSKIPDDGAYVLPNDITAANAGRWVQQFEGDVLDVRRFGALPDLVENADVTAKVVNAITYAQGNLTRTRPITVGFIGAGTYEFAGDFDFTSYSDFIDLTDNSRHHMNWLIGAGVAFKGSNSHFTLSKNTVCLSTERLVYGTGCTLSVEGGGGIEVDPAWWGSGPCSVEDCYVKCNSVTTNVKHFTRCVVSSERKLAGNVELQEMTFNEGWFVDNFAWSNLTLTDTSITVNDCFSADSYINIKNARGDYYYGDLGEQTVSNKVFGSGCLVENAFLDECTIQGGEFHNVSGTAKTTGTPSLNMIDCWLEFTNASSATFKKVEWRRGSFKSYKSIEILTSALFHDVVIEVNLTISCSGPIFNGCEIKNDVSQNAVNDAFEFIFKDCRFSARHVLTGSGTNILVNGSWEDNFSSIDYPVIVDGNTIPLLSPVDSSHKYVYSGNTGKFLPTEKTVVMTLRRYTSNDGSNLPAPNVWDTYLSAGDFAFVDGFGVPVSSAFVNSGICVKTGGQAIRLFCLGTTLGGPVDASMDVCIVGTTGLTAANVMEHPYEYQETVHAETYKVLGPTGEVNIDMFDGFHKKIMQYSTNDDNESVIECKAVFKFKLRRN